MELATPYMKFESIRKKQNKQKKVFLNSAYVSQT